MEILQKVLKSVRMPDAEQKNAITSAEKFLEKLEASIKKCGYDAVPVIGGSTAKGTMVRDDFDIDIFVRFSTKYKDEDLSYMLDEILNGQNVDRVHGSRDYYIVEYNSMTIEIVPVLRIDYPRQAKNVTDMSPLHVFWIEKVIDKHPEIRNEIIIAKSFCKAQGVYGAESYISGFSGHVLDILISYYGSFLKLLENAVQWQKYKVIDISGHGNELNKSKISPLIVIDPVDRNRNAAAALSEAKFMEFKKAAKEFLKKPDINFFFQVPITEEVLRKKSLKNKLIIARIEPIDGKNDVAGAKLLKIFDYIRKQLVVNDFELMDSGWYWKQGEKAILWYMLPTKLLESTRLHIGPPLSAEESAKKFAKKHPASFVKGSRLVVKIQRKFRDSKELAREILHGEYVSSRCRSADLK